MHWFIDIGDDSKEVGGWTVYSAEYDEELARDHYTRWAEHANYSIRLRRAPHALDLGDIVAAHFGGRPRDHVAPRLSPAFDPFKYTE
jgi:hypothetical protein